MTEGNASFRLHYSRRSLDAKRSNSGLIGILTTSVNGSLCFYSVPSHFARWSPHSASGPFGQRSCCECSTVDYEWHKIAKTAICAPCTSPTFSWLAFPKDAWSEPMSLCVGLPLPPIYFQPISFFYPIGLQKCSKTSAHVVLDVSNTGFF